MKAMLRSMTRPPHDRLEDNGNKTRSYGLSFCALLCALALVVLVFSGTHATAQQLLQQQPPPRNANAVVDNQTAPPVAAAANNQNNGGVGSGTGTANPVVLIAVLGVLSLAPFALIMLTSFVKISVVLSLLRNALGTQQVPPNQVITGLSLILAIFIMSPVLEKMAKASGDLGNFDSILSSRSIEQLVDGAYRAREPLRDFLDREAHPAERKMFYDLAQQIAKRNGNDPMEIGERDFRVVVPAFVISELTEAFKIGFILFLPFLVIDMVVSNILQAMGMMMLSPVMISLPFKLLLFVLIDGWSYLVRELVMSYVVST